MKAAKPKWADRLSSKLILLVAATLAGFAFLEVFTRLFSLAPSYTRIEIDTPHGVFTASDNPILKYVPKPGTEGVNDYGIRDYTYPIAKPEGVSRIVVIGDSWKEQTGCGGTVSP